MLKAVWGSCDMPNILSLPAFCVLSVSLPFIPPFHSPSCSTALSSAMVVWAVALYDLSLCYLTAYH